MTLLISIIQTTWSGGHQRSKFLIKCKKGEIKKNNDLKFYFAPRPEYLEKIRKGFKI